MGNPFINPRILSYCPGILGLDRGLKRALGATRTVAFVEIEAFIVENLLAGMEAGLVDEAPCWLNLKTFDASPFRGAVDIITGGYPCQPFSNAGERRGVEDPRHLYPYLERDIAAIRPVCCFFENVGGHLSLGFDEVYRSLSALGYAVEAGIFTAEEVGAPHERERLFILAIRKDWLADTKRVRSDAGGERIRWQEGADAHRRSERAELGSAKSELLQGRDRSGQEQIGGSDSPREVEHSTSEGLQVAGQAGQAGQCELPTEAGAQILNRPEQSGSEVANPISVGSVKGIEERQHQFSYKNTSYWPSRPEEQQYEWEEPRTIKPGLGITVAGYNFREDLLRAAGNSVVEQTAELAFITLMKEHGL